MVTDPIRQVVAEEGAQRCRHRHQHDIQLARAGGDFRVEGPRQLGDLPVEARQPLVLAGQGQRQEVLRHHEDHQHEHEHEHG